MRQANGIGANVNWSQVIAQDYFVVDSSQSRRPQRICSEAGLSVTSECEDEGQNLYFDASQDCLIVDEKASRRGRIDSEGAGAQLCGKSTADSRRGGA